MSTIVHENKRFLMAFDLASGFSVAEVAGKFGLCRKTIYRQLKKPAFRELVHRMRDEMVSNAMSRMANSMSEAADTLGAMIKSDNPNIQVRASRAVIRLGLDMREAVEITGRIANLEREMEIRGLA